MNTKESFLDEIINILSDTSTFSSDVDLITYNIDEKGNITGKFKDSHQGRLFDFKIDDSGVKYKPSPNLDSFTLVEAVTRFDAYSAGASTVYKALDSTIIGKRTKRPTCTSISYNCGLACIDIRKACAVSLNENITPLRIAKLKKMALAIRNGGKGNDYANSISRLATNLTSKYKEKALKETFKQGRETRQKFSSLNKAERKAKDETRTKDVESKRKKEELVVSQRKEGYAKAIAQMASVRGQLKSGEDVAALLGSFQDSVKKGRENLVLNENIRIGKETAKVFVTQGPSKAIEFYGEQRAKAEERYAEYSKTMIKAARELLYVDNPSKMSPRSGGVVIPETGAKTGELDTQQSKKFATGLREFQKLVGVSSLDGKTIKAVAIDPKSPKSGRSFYRGKSNTIYIADNAPVAVVIHEAAHWLEESDPTIHKKVQAFLEKRTAGEQWQKLSVLTGNKAYKDTEVAKPDKFMKAYMGKKTNSKDNSEILSMGIEHMYRDPIKFANQDPEYFAFIYNTLRGK